MLIFVPAVSLMLCHIYNMIYRLKSIIKRIATGQCITPSRLWHPLGYSLNDYKYIHICNKKSIRCLITSRDRSPLFYESRFQFSIQSSFKHVDIRI